MNNNMNKNLTNKIEDIVLFAVALTVLLLMIIHWR